MNHEVIAGDVEPKEGFWGSRGFNICGLRGRSRRGGKMQIQLREGTTERLDPSDERLGDLRAEENLGCRELKDSMSRQRKMHGGLLRKSLMTRRKHEIKGLGARVSDEAVCIVKHSGAEGRRHLSLPPRQGESQGKL